MPRLVVHRRAARYLERIEEKIKAQFLVKLERLASNPSGMPRD
jgi:hypothetical protein